MQHILKDFSIVSYRYDGHWDGNELKHGLGQLIDGKFGHDDFKEDFYVGQTWVGWKNDSRHNKPVEIKFEFDKVREFSAVHIFCNNQFTKEVQVSKIIGGRYYIPKYFSCLNNH